MKLIYFFVALFFSQTLIAENAPSSFLVSYQLEKSYTRKELKEFWRKNNIPRFIMPVKNDVDVYEIIYKVQWIDSTWRDASGICFIPKVDHPVPYMMFGHGTQIHKKRVISEKVPEQTICTMFATDGYAAFFPDYYGIGKGQGKHLYQHAWSEAHAFIYMLYAVDELKEKLGFSHNGQLFLTGYSQGGHSSLAAHKYLEELNDPRFQVTASSPMSGAYDMTGEQGKYMFEEYPRPFYLPYLLLSYQEAYGIIETDNIYDIFKQPFDSLFPLYFENNNRRTLHELDSLMPKVPVEILRDTFVYQFLNNPEFRFKQCLEQNNLTCWKPEAPVQLCYCKGDREVNYMNSVSAYNEMKEQGAENVKHLNLSDDLDHNSCAAFGVLATKYFMDRFKDKGKNPRMKDLPWFKKPIVNFVKRKEEKKARKKVKDKAYF